MSNKLAGKIAVVTGGTSGIGLATARDFIAEGARVVITGRKKEEVEKTASETGALGIVSDQGKLTDIDNLVKQVRSSLGNIDILFINAGIVLFSSIEEATEEHFDRY
jgi:NAD(P)-dependent dehydrogenase (short-subunit alcohol dehydrogenase family)